MRNVYFLFFCLIAITNFRCISTDCCTEYYMHIDIRFKDLKGKPLFGNGLLNPDENLTINYLLKDQIYYPPSNWDYNKGYRLKENDPAVFTIFLSDKLDNTKSTTILNIKGYASDTIYATFNTKNGVTLKSFIINNKFYDKIDNTIDIIK